MKRLLLIAILLPAFLVHLSSQDFTNFRIPETIVSPEVSGDTTVFRLAGEYATDVRIEGSWLDKPVPMQKREGVWESRFTGLKGEYQTYRFLVEGTPALDPSNPMVMRSGSEYRNYFIAGGPQAALYAPASQRGSISYVWLESSTIGTTRRMAVYTPYGYEYDKRRKYPVLYLMHGENGDEESWLTMGCLSRILDNLIQQGRAVPMIVVMPNCSAVEQAARTLSLPEVRNARTTSTAVFMSSLIHEVIPFIETNYRALPQKSSRAICGIGINGTTAINAAVMYPDIFDFVLPLSCGVEDNGHLVEDFLRIKKAKVKLFWTGCGTMDKVAYEPSKRLHDILSYVHLDHTYYILNGGRDWDTWRHFLIYFAPMIFKHYTD